MPVSSSTPDRPPSAPEIWAIWGCGPRMTCVRGRQNRSQEVVTGEVNAAVDVRVAIPATPGASASEHSIRFFPSFEILERAYVPAMDQPTSRIHFQEPDSHVLGLPAVPPLRELVHELASAVATRAGGQGLLLVPQVWATSDASARILKPFTDSGWRLGAIEAACPPLPKGTRIVGGDSFFAWINDSNRAVAVSASPQAAVALALIDDVLLQIAEKAPAELWKRWLAEEWPKTGWFTRQQIAERVRRALIGHTLLVDIGGLEDPILAVSSVDKSRVYGPLGQIRLHIEVPTPPSVRDWLQGSASAARLGPWTAQPVAIVGSPDLGRLRRAIEEQSADIRSVELGMLAPLALGGGRDLRGFVRVVPDDVLAEEMTAGARAPMNPPPPTKGTPPPMPADVSPRIIPDLRPPEPATSDAKPKNILQRVLGRSREEEKVAPAPEVLPRPPRVAQRPPDPPRAPAGSAAASASSLGPADGLDNRTGAGENPLQSEPPWQTDAPVVAHELAWARRVIEIPTGYEWNRPVEVEIRVDGVPRPDCAVRQSRIAGVQYLIEDADRLPARALITVKFEPLFHE